MMMPAAMGATPLSGLCNPVTSGMFSKLHTQYAPATCASSGNMSSASFGKLSSSSSPSTLSSSPALTGYLSQLRGKPACIPTVSNFDPSDRRCHAGLRPPKTIAARLKPQTSCFAASQRMRAFDPAHMEAATAATAAITAFSPSETKNLSDVLSNAGKKALGGGIPGMAAMGIQVLSLMWLRTTINYQYRYGTSTGVALKTLYKEGGVVR